MAEVFGGTVKAKLADPDLGAHHSNIGKLTLENDFLEWPSTSPARMEIILHRAGSIVQINDASLHSFKNGCV